MRARSFAIVILFLLAMSAFGQQEGRTAEVKWTAVPAETGTTNHELRWIVRENSDHTFQVLTTPPEAGFRLEAGFAPGFKPLSYRLEKLRPPANAMSLTCAFAEASLTCDGDFHATHSHAQLKIARPYIFLVEEYSGDIYATFAGLLAQAERIPGKTTVVTSVGIRDSATDKFQLEAQEQEKVLYVGRERIHLKIGVVNAHKYVVDEITFWTADSGLPLAMEQEGEDVRLEVVELHDPNHLLLP